MRKNLNIILCILMSLTLITMYHLSEGSEKMQHKIIKTEEEWKKTLTPEQYRVTRQKGTEQPFTGKYYKNNETGTYHCVCCGAELFSSETKYDSGCGWPSFSTPKNEENIDESTDKTLGMVRTEITCSSCGAHLGHVFNDGPQPAGTRYCVNSASLVLKPAEEKQETATFGAGCFWCTEAVYERIDGIISVKPGYMGGKTKNPSYKEVCTGNTGHAEVAQIKFNPEKISYPELLEWFWKMHDPTTLNRQGADAGTQYRSAVFYHSGKQKKEAEESLKKHNSSEQFKNKIVTEITEASEFYPAENYHHDYFNNNTDAPYCRAVIAPKLKKLNLDKIKP